MLPSSVAVRGAVRPDPDQARAWLERELARPEYRRSLAERFFSWLGDLLDRLTGAALGASELSTATAVVLLVLVLVLAAVVVSRLRREPAARRDDAVLLDRETSPEEHRARASAALQVGRHEEALVEAFRALASRSLRRGLVDERPGLTAHELADDLTSAFPDRSRDLVHAASVFDRVFYGHQRAVVEDATAVLALDEALRTARPAGRTPSGGDPVAAVPR